MQKITKMIIGAIVFAITFSGIDMVAPNWSTIEAAPTTRPSSKPSPSKPSRPSSTPSKPSTPPPSKPSTPSTPPPSKPSTPSTPPPSTPSKPSSTPSRPSSTPSTPTSSKPSSSSSSDSKKPTGTFSSDSEAKKKADSKVVYQKATAPKESYTTKTGQTVKVDPTSVSTKQVRNLSPDAYSNRTTRVEHHYHDRYGSRYNYYQSQPVIYVGGGYSSLFWYAMMDWSLERRALWMYHNQNTIDQQRYNEQVQQNAALQKEIQKLKEANAPINAEYVDSEFKDNPDLMYSDEFVSAAYNPSPSSSSGFASFLLIAGVCLLIAFLVWIIFFRDFKGN